MTPGFPDGSLHAGGRWQTRVGTGHMASVAQLDVRAGGTWWNEVGAVHMASVCWLEVAHGIPAYFSLPAAYSRGDIQL